jgi:hypothetical protein
VNRSAVPVGLVPAGVVIVTSTVPVPAGDVAVICVAEFTVKLAAAVAPKFTAVAPVKPVPVIVTDVPPAAGPEVGVIEEIDGPPVYVNRSALPVALTPPSVETTTSTVPDPAGDVAVICVSEFTVKPVAPAVPNRTSFAVVKPVPVMVTFVPPVVGPAVGVIPVTDGTGGIGEMYAADGTGLVSDVVHTDSGGEPAGGLVTPVSVTRRTSLAATSPLTSRVTVAPPLLTTPPHPTPLFWVTSKSPVLHVPVNTVPAGAEIVTVLSDVSPPVGDTLNVTRYSTPVAPAVAFDTAVMTFDTLWLPAVMV